MRPKEWELFSSTLKVVWKFEWFIYEKFGVKGVLLGSLKFSCAFGGKDMPTQRALPSPAWCRCQCMQARTDRVWGLGCPPARFIFLKQVRLCPTWPKAVRLMGSGCGSCTPQPKAALPNTVQNGYWTIATRTVQTKPFDGSDKTVLAVLSNNCNGSVWTVVTTHQPLKTAIVFLL